jgi:hypothetical protein
MTPAAQAAPFSVDQLFSDTCAASELTCGVTHDRELVRRLVNDWHSLLSAPQGWKVAFLLSAGNTIVGVATVGHPVARLEDQAHTLELTRMALHGAPQNSATFFLARIREHIKTHFPEITRLISYQDTAHHSWTMYKADNWRPVFVSGADQVSHTWRNRPGRIGNERKQLAKWEHSIYQRS